MRHCSEASLRRPNAWVLAVLLAAIAASPIRPATSDPFLVVQGHVVASDIKYTPIGRATGASYAGSATVQVKETLKAVGLSNVNQGQQISIVVEERAKKPTWGRPSKGEFIFLLEPIRDHSEFRAVYVVAIDPELARIARERKYESLQELQELLGHKSERHN